MIRTRLLVFVAVPLVAGLSLTACNRDRRGNEAQPVADPVEASATSDVPLTFQQATPYAKVDLTLPDSLKSQPVWHDLLYREEVGKLRIYLDGAEGAGSEEGGEDAPVYEQTVTISAAGETGKLLSLSREAREFTGSQTNTLFDGLLWDKAMKRGITFTQLFKDNADLSVIDQALCSALNADRDRRGHSGTLKLGVARGCPSAREAAPTLSVPAGAGQTTGLTFRVTASQVGEPVDAPAYELTVPVTIFRGLIAPAYASEFSR